MAITVKLRFDENWDKLTSYLVAAIVPKTLQFKNHSMVSSQKSVGFKSTGSCTTFAFFTKQPGFKFIKIQINQNSLIAATCYQVKLIHLLTCHICIKQIVSSLFLFLFLEKVAAFKCNRNNLSYFLWFNNLCNLPDNKKYLKKKPARMDMEDSPIFSSISKSKSINTCIAFYLHIMTSEWHIRIWFMF